MIDDKAYLLFLAIEYATRSCLVIESSAPVAQEDAAKKVFEDADVLFISLMVYMMLQI